MGISRMILSHKHRFIFIKTAKTAGTSIEIALSKFCGPDDIITPISAQDETIRRQRGYRGPQNYHVPLKRYHKMDWLKLFAKGKRLTFYNHIGAAPIREWVGQDVWNNYYKFCFERNPWDKVLSFYHHYYWQFPDEPRTTLSEFIHSGLANKLIGLGFDLYAAQGEILVDKVGLYENMQADLDQIARKLNLPGSLELPRAKGHVRTDRTHYRELLTAEDREKIGKIFAREIAHFGYVY